MLPALPLMLQATKTLREQMQQWFSKYPPGSPWRVASDYAIGDPNKLNDVLSFVIVAPHATDDDVQGYVGGVAPKDIKKVSEVPLGLMQYLTCPEPITFSVSFVLARESALLRDFMAVDDLALVADYAVETIEGRMGLYPAEEDRAVYRAAIGRFKVFKTDLLRKNVNAKLARQIHLAAAAAATVFNCLNQAVSPSAIRWMSDRDKLIAQHDAVVFDLAHLYYLLQASLLGTPEQIANCSIGASLARLLFETPEQTGDHRFDDFVRLPDYLAGTLADMNMQTLEVTRDKFGVMLHGVLINSPNNWVVQLLKRDEGGITARSAQFRGWN